MARESLPPRLCARLDLGRAIAIGRGKADLLAAIAETGSISDPIADEPPEPDFSDLRLCNL